MSSGIVIGFMGGQKEAVSVAKTFIICTFALIELNEIEAQEDFQTHLKNLRALADLSLKNIDINAQRNSEFQVKLQDLIKEYGGENE